MKLVRNLVTFFVIIAIATFAGASPRERKVPAGLRDLAKVGKPTKQARIDEVVAMAEGRKRLFADVKSLSLPSPVGEATGGVIMKDVTFGAVVWTGRLEAGSVLVQRFKWPNSSLKPITLPSSITATEAGQFSLVLQEGNTAGLWYAEGNPPDLEILIFNPTDGTLSSTSTRMDFWNPPTQMDGGIGDIYVVDGRMKITGNFAPGSSVWVDYQRLPSWSVVVLSDHIEINLSALNADYAIYPGGNYNISVVSREKSDSLRYRYNAANTCAGFDPVTGRTCGN